MGKPRQRAVGILGLQHQSGRCGSRASGRTSKESIANGGRPTASGEPFDSKPIKKSRRSCDAPSEFDAQTEIARGIRDGAVPLPSSVRTINQATLGAAERKKK